MKKLKLFTITVISVLTVGLVGCGKEVVKEDNKEALNIPQIANRLEQQSDGLLSYPNVVTQANQSWIFEEVKDKIEDGVVSQAMMNVKLEDIIVIKTQDKEAIKEVIEDYREETLKNFADGYGGEENIDAVANSVIGEEGDIVYFVASPKAESIVEEVIMGVNKK